MSILSRARSAALTAIACVALTSCNFAWPEGTHVLFPTEFAATTRNQRISIGCDIPEVIAAIEPSRVLFPAPLDDPVQYTLTLVSERVDYEAGMSWWRVVLANVLLPIGPFKAFSWYEGEVRQTFRLASTTPGGSDELHSVAARFDLMGLDWVDDNRKHYPVAHLIRHARRAAAARLTPLLLEQLEVPHRNKVRLVSTSELQAIQDAAWEAATANQPTDSR